ncbi:MAG: isochorismatase family protein [Geminicoccaceae bacterium]|jgi:maleamate amidohydrolase|nr:isochorismatase family protein [Geminicoccaceae bacterium]MCB9966098.1 isochorismatase family protein [Geminicoccaceae bacterium]HRY26856.1 isochorismatase family protein [Geminicoccaceae bacterium]
MTESDVYARQGFGAVVGSGERPALLVVDFVNAFADPRMLGGGNIEAAVAATVPVLRACRERSLPVVFTRIVYAEDGSDAGVWATKLPALRQLTPDSPANRVVDALAPLPGELVIDKKQASAFFGTDLAPWLVQRRVDTLYVTGCTTSGCVRASVVDAVGWNFRPIVIEDCVGDRAEGPHAANLFDMRQKYADLVTAEAAIRAIAGGA